MTDQEIWERERGFWLDGVAYYHDNMVEAAQMVFPDPVGILKGSQILEGLEAAPRWTAVEMDGRRDGRPHRGSARRHTGPGLPRHRNARRIRPLRGPVLQHLCPPGRQVDLAVASADAAPVIYSNPAQGSSRATGSASTMRSNPPSGTRPASDWPSTNTVASGATRAR